MSETQQNTIFGAPIQENVRIKTSGRTIRPFKQMIGQIADEYRLDITNDGISVEVVDSANVCAIEIHMENTAFESFDVSNETSIGISSSTFGSVLQHTRYGKNTDDTVTLVADDKHIESETLRDIGGTTAQVTERGEVIDPDAIRQSPDMPDLDMSASVDLPPKSFIETIQLMDANTGQPTRIEAGEYLTLRQNTEKNKRNVELNAMVDGEATAVYSTSYLADIATALKSGYVDTMSIKWDDEFPIFVDFEREDHYSGRIMLAPRVHPDNEEL